MSFSDKKLNCRDCGKEFVWTAGEQDFFSKKGFGAPLRCPECRQKRKGQKQGEGSQMQASSEITCAQCGKKSEVPFKLKDPSKSVYCAECFSKQRVQQK